MKTIKHLLKNLNRRIAELRMEAGLTQEQLAERMDVPLRALQYWEANRTISLRGLFKMAEVLGRDPGDFFTPPKVQGVKKGRPSKRTITPSKPAYHKKSRSKPNHL